jgi:hypothetical protein
VFIAVVFVAAVFVDVFADVAVVVVALALAPAVIVNNYQKSEIIVIAVGSNIDFKFLIH